MSLIEDMGKLVREHADVQNAAFNLWDWQPSCARERKRGRCHDDRQPSTVEVINTATEMLSYLAGYNNNELTDEEKVWTLERFGPRAEPAHRKFHDWPHELAEEDKCS